MLFSATLPSTVAEFVRAGLVNPAVVRLDADVKINPDLTTHFFRVSGGDKDAGLMVLLDQAAIVPGGESAVKEQAIVFVATKHHVEYLVNMLTAAGFSASHVYGSLDQVARQRQLQDFRDRKTSLLVVTDVAARGLDIPVMDHVINYDFPPNARVFIHRVGRTARGGRKGTAWSILDKDDLPYYADLAVNLNATATPPILHTLPRQSLDAATEAIKSLSASSSDLDDLRAVMRKGDSMYRRSRSKATAAGYRTARQLAVNDYPLFPGIQADAQDNSSARRAELISVLDAFRPVTTGITAKPPKVRTQPTAAKLADEEMPAVDSQTEAKPVDSATRKVRANEALR
jgi:ATP-dependent RNA helicase DDX54/DBP10